MLLEEGESRVEKGDGALGGFIRQELGESEARLPNAQAYPFCAERTPQAAGAAMVVDGDAEELPARARGGIVLPIAGDATAGAHDACEPPMSKWMRSPGGSRS